MVSAEVQLRLNTSGQILGLNVPEDVYMRDYAEDFCEWVDGTIVKLPPVHDRHDLIIQHFIMLFNAYFELRPIGKLRQQPFVMRLEFEQDGKTKRRNSEPDLQLILNENLENLKPTYMDGAADIVIEVVSPESASRDYGEKFHEYEQAGVPEYWMIDPIKKECRFYRLTPKKPISCMKLKRHTHQPNSRNWFYTSRHYGTTRCPAQSASAKWFRKC